ncbi:hypothetical protein [Shimia abyssi]|nr:hypothetical protein [Shimia abyssi]
MLARLQKMRKLAQRLGLATAFAVSGWTFANAETHEPSAEVWSKSGDWLIFVDDPELGGCFMERSFEDGTIMRLGLKLISHEGYFVVLNKDWKDIQEGQAGEIFFDFGDEVFGGDAIGIIDGESHGGWAEFNNPELVSELANGFSFVVSGSAKIGFEYALKGTKRAIAEMDACRVEQRNR